MARIIASSVDFRPSRKVLGLAYRVKMMDNVIPQKWDEFFKENKHLVLERLRKDFPIEDPLDYVGLMTGYDPIEETMIYVIGAIMDLKTPDPEGYQAFILPEGEVLTTVVEGKGEVYGQAHELTLRSVDTTHYEIPEDLWSMEVYAQRWMDANAKQDGSVVLDYRIPLIRK